MAEHFIEVNIKLGFAVKPRTLLECWTSNLFDQLLCGQVAADGHHGESLRFRQRHDKPPQKDFSHFRVIRVQRSDLPKRTAADLDGTEAHTLSVLIEGNECPAVLFFAVQFEGLLSLVAHECQIVFEHCWEVGFFEGYDLNALWGFVRKSFVVDRVVGLVHDGGP